MRSRQLVGMALAGLEAHHRNNSGTVHSTAEGRVPPAMCPGPQENMTTTMESLESFHFSEHVFQRLWSKLDAYRSAKCAGAYTLPKWQREPTTGFVLLAGDEGGSPLIEEGLSDGRRVNRLVLRNREVYSGY